MEEKFNLCEIFPLDAMHDQKITRSELSAGTLSFYFEDLHFDEPHSPEATLYYNKHRKYRGCVLTFFELDDADLFVELLQKSQSGIEIIKYYDGEWIQFLQSHHFNVEVYDFYCGYRCAIICGTLVTPAGLYSDDCMIKVTADKGVPNFDAGDISVIDKVVCQVSADAQHLLKLSHGYDVRIVRKHHLVEFS